VVIAILVNQLYFRERSETRGTSVSEHAITQKSHKNQSTTALHEEKNDSAIKTQKEEKEEKKEIIESKVKVFFLRVNDRTERVSLVPVTRTIKGSASLEKALGELIKGPNQTERGKGLLSAVPSNIKVRGVSVKNGIAEIDFNDAVERNAAGSILISRLDQIVYTATEMDGIRGVIIKINGRRRQVFGSDGLSIGGPLHRRQ
jgi:spore germination protein GerM